MERSMGDRSRGLFDKFRVDRTDGSDNPGGKHYECEYFVLDLTHDEHARPALRAYAESCRRDGYEKLADDLEARAHRMDVALSRALREAGRFAVGQAEGEKR